METILQNNLQQDNYKVLYQQLYSIPPREVGSNCMLGLKLWLLTSPRRTWMELAWGLYRGHLDKALKQARHEILEEEGKHDISDSLVGQTTRSLNQWFVTIPQECC